MPHVSVFGGIHAVQMARRGRPSQPAGGFVAGSRKLSSVTETRRPQGGSPKRHALSYSRRGPRVYADVARSLQSMNGVRVGGGGGGVGRPGRRGRHEFAGRRRSPVERAAPATRASDGGTSQSCALSEGRAWRSSMPRYFLRTLYGASFILDAMLPLVCAGSMRGCRPGTACEFVAEDAGVASANLVRDA